MATDEPNSLTGPISMLLGKIMLISPNSHATCASAYVLARLILYSRSRQKHIRATAVSPGPTIARHLVFVPTGLLGATRKGHLTDRAFHEPLAQAAPCVAALSGKRRLVPTARDLVPALQRLAQ